MIVTSDSNRPRGDHPRSNRPRIAPASAILRTIVVVGLLVMTVSPGPERALAQDAAPDPGETPADPGTMDPGGGAPETGDEGAAQPGTQPETQPGTEAQPGTEEPGSEAPGAPPQGDVTEEVYGDEDDDTPLLEQWRETLLYGIDSEVQELLPVLASHGETELNDEVLSILESRPNPRVKTAAFEFFMSVDDPAGTEEAVAILSSPRSHRGELVRSALRYLRNGDFELPEEAFEELRSLARSPRTGHAGEAARVLGEKGEGSTDAEAILDTFSRTADDELRGQLVLALGDLGHEDAVEPLLDIARDTAAPPLLRGYAADALGRIGDPRALEVLESMVGDEEAIVRAYAVSALGRFDDEDVAPVLSAALRDSVAQVREFALQGVARNGIADAVPAVMYRARRDPEKQVRAAAFEALAQLATDEALEFLEDRILDTDHSAEDRMAVASALIEHRLADSVALLEEIVEAEWETEDSQLLGFIARELGRTEHDGLDAVYERLLDHPDPGVQVHALRGIGANRIGRLREIVEEKTDENAHPAVKQNAKAVLERLD
ncbi:MAG: HEAT repeat domain-containing protein [Spirochaetaceae bacterium]